MLSFNFLSSFSLIGGGGSGRGGCGEVCTSKYNHLSLYNISCICIFTGLILQEKQSSSGRTPLGCLHGFCRLKFRCCAHRNLLPEPSPFIVYADYLRDLFYFCVSVWFECVIAQAGHGICGNWRTGIEHWWLGDFWITQWKCGNWTPVL